MKFTDFDLAPEILKGIADAGFTDCTDVQAETFKNSFQGKDVCVQSQTGTGKTAAYLVTIFKLFSSGMVPTKKALIMVPTRELAVQIEKEAKLLGGDYLGLRTASFFGGVGYNQQEEALRKGVDIMIATPGRLIDFFKSGKVKLNDVSVLVIDEADRMFDMGFIPDIRYLIKKMPGSKERRTLLFSATLSQKVKSLAWEYMQDPAEVEIMPESITVDKITQVLYHVGSDEKFRLLLGLLKKHNPSNAIIFTNMKRTAEIISKKLAANGYPNEYIMGDLPQKKRLKIIEGVKKGDIKFLIATDVAARGLHVDDLDMVINYDIPEDFENYVHRIGRTARAGKSGMAISLACERYVQGLEAIEKYIDMKIPVEWFDESFLADDASFGMRFERDHDRGGRGERGRRGDRGDRHDRGRKGERRGDRGPRREGEPRRDHAPCSTGEHHGTGHPQRQAQGKTPRYEREKRSFDAKRGERRTEQRPSHSQQTQHPRQHQNQSQKGYLSHRSKVVPRRDGSIEERVAYYRQKYGENFVITDDMLRDDKSKKPSLLKKIKGLFSRKK